LRFKRSELIYIGSDSHNSTFWTNAVDALLDAQKHYHYNETNITGRKVRNVILLIAS